VPKQSYERRNRADGRKTRRVSLSTLIRRAALYSLFALASRARIGRREARDALSPLASFDIFGSEPPRRRADLSRREETRLIGDPRVHLVKERLPGERARDGSRALACSPQGAYRALDSFISTFAARARARLISERVILAASREAFGVSNVRSTFDSFEFPLEFPRVQLSSRPDVCPNCDKDGRFREERSSTR
jgi:hypothetical protein